MPPDKHLVLDPDVHERLKSRKRQLGTTVREIGNAVLRSVLDQPPISEVIAKKLIREGKISAEDYHLAREEALSELHGLHREVAEVLHSKEGGTFTSGSWEVSIGQSGAALHYQVFDAWALDDEGRPLDLHCHAESNEYFIVLEGRVLITLNEKEIMLDKGDCFRIQPGLAHAVTPLTNTTRAVVICQPPDPSFDHLEETDS